MNIENLKRQLVSGIDDPKKCIHCWTETRRITADDGISVIITRVCIICQAIDVVRSNLFSRMNA